MKSTLITTWMFAVLLAVPAKNAITQQDTVETIIISGKADFPERNTLGFFEAFPKYVGDYRYSDTIGIKDDGTFYKNIALNTPRLCVLTMGCHRLVRFLYAAPGDSIHATITLPGTVPVAEFSGPHARLHNFMNRYDEKLSEVEHSVRARPRATDSLVQRRKHAEAELERFYYSYFGSDFVPPLITHAVMTDIRCRLPSAVITHIVDNYYRPMNRGEPPFITFNDDDVGIEEMMPKADTLSVRMPLYQQMLVKYAGYLGMRRRVSEMRSKTPFLESICTYTSQEVSGINDALLRNAIMYSTILFNARMPFGHYKECAHEMLAVFRTEAKDYQYYVSAKEKVEGD